MQSILTKLASVIASLSMLLAIGSHGVPGSQLAAADASIAPPTVITFSFTLASAGATSAGVYSNGVLIRTLWSNVQYTAGAHTGTWDGTEDDGSVAPTGSYTVKVLSSNVTYTWEGVVGNTSSSYTGPTTNHAEDIIFGMAISGSTMYYATGYNEGEVSMFKASTSNPQSKTTILPGKGGAFGVSTYFVATDGTYVYWAANDPSVPANYFVFATKTSDDSEAVFANGVPVTLKYGNPFASAIDQVNIASSTITGLAVQKNGSYLFVSHGDLNRIDVLNKTTGALVRSVTITAPKSLATDASNGLWVTSGTSANPVVQKYTVAADGTLSAVASSSIKSLQDPLALAISPDNATLLIADGGTSQQLKAFSTATASSTWVYGQAGGYATDPTVTNDKFFFHDFENLTFHGGIDWTYLAYQPDGSFWIGDSGNDRSQHLAANRTFIDTLMWIPTFYSAFVDPNDPTRVFANALEFHIDYSKPLGPDNGSWTVVKNWGYNILTNLLTNCDDQYGVLRNVTTLSNGRTYATLRCSASLSQLQFVELPPTGGLRFTGIMTPNLYYALASDGSLHVVSGNPMTFSKESLTGFDASNNPQYGPLTTVASSPAITADGPAWYSSLGIPWEMTSSNIIPVFDARVPHPAYANDPVTHAGFHLGGLNVASGAWQWKASPSTDTNYLGDWPSDGSFDIGNRVLSAGSRVNVLGDNIFYQYYGEGWKSTEVNEWTQTNDDGLMIGQFGTTSVGNGVDGQEGQPGMAGNAFSNTVVQGPNGVAYAYQNDESFHGGVGRWRIDNLSTIKEQSIPVTWNASQYKKVTDPTDLLAGLPYASTVADGTAGWHRTPALDVSDISYSDWWKVITNVLIYKKTQSPDLNMSFVQNGSATVTRDLGTPSASTTSWTLAATVSFTGPDEVPYGGIYFDILDDAGKVISRVYPNMITYESDYRLLGNSQVIVESSGSGSITAFQKLIDTPTTLTITASNGKITYSYGSNAPVTTSVFDATSHWNKPATLKLYFWSEPGGMYNHTIDFQTLHFSTIPSLVPVPPTIISTPPPVTPTTTPPVIVSTTTTSTGSTHTVQLSFQGQQTLAATGTVFILNPTTKAILAALPVSSTAGSLTVTAPNALVPSNLQTSVLLRISIPGYLSRVLSVSTGTTTWSIPALLPGDLNGDGVINSIDYSLLETHWKQLLPAYGFTAQGIVSTTTLQLLLSNWLAKGQ